MEDSAFPHGRLPIGSVGHKAAGWWGMWGLIATEAALFVYLLFAYYYLASQADPPWLPEGLPKLRLALPNTLLLIGSSLVLWWGERGIQQGRQNRLVLGLGLAFLMGAVFVGVQLLEWHNKHFSPQTSAYGSLYFTTTGFHLAHVLAGLVMLCCAWVWAALGYFGAGRHAAVSIGAVYWHFVDVVWLAVFGTYYLSPYLG